MGDKRKETKDGRHGEGRLGSVPPLPPMSGIANNFCRVTRQHFIYIKQNPNPDTASGVMFCFRFIDAVTR